MPAPDASLRSCSAADARLRDRGQSCPHGCARAGAGRRHGDGVAGVHAGPRPGSRQLVRRLRRAVQPARIRGHQRAAAGSLGSGDQGDGARAAVRPGVLQQHRVDVPRPDGLVRPDGAAREPHGGDDRGRVAGGLVRVRDAEHAALRRRPRRPARAPGHRRPALGVAVQRAELGSADPPPVRANLSAARRGAARPRRARSDPLHGWWHPRHDERARAVAGRLVLVHGDLHGRPARRLGAAHLLGLLGHPEDRAAADRSAGHLAPRSPSSCAGRSSSPSSAFAACGRSRAS